MNDDEQRQAIEKRYLDNHRDLVAAAFGRGMLIFALGIGLGVAVVKATRPGDDQELWANIAGGLVAGTALFFVEWISSLHDRARGRHERIKAEARLHGFELPDSP